MTVELETFYPGLVVSGGINRVRGKKGVGGPLPFRT